MDINAFLCGRDVREIRVGQSGADVYEVDDEMILKHVRRDALEGDKFDTYSREALFYQEKSQKGCSYIPEIMDSEVTEDEIIILMRKYDMPALTDVDDQMLDRIADLLVHIHYDEIPSFLKGADDEIKLMTDDEILQCLNGWKSVFDEHPGAFDMSPLEEVAAKINEIISWHATEKCVITHGDFHRENLLTDGSRALLICDWQGVKVAGESEDLSFFMSRLSADGIKIDPKSFASKYSEAALKLTGEKADPELILKHIDAANVITTFMYWHYFLHGNPEERVREVYDKMMTDARNSGV